MELVNDILGMLHLPGATFFETVGAGVALTFGYMLAKLVVRLAARIPAMLQRASGPPPASARRR